MGARFSRIKTWVTKEVLTASALNAEFNNVLNNLQPSGIDDESANDAAAQATSDPYAGSSLVKATSLEEELQQLRYLIAQITGKTYWYIDPDISLAGIYGGTEWVTTAMINFASFSRCIIELTADQDIPAGSNTTVQFNSEIEDVLDEFNPATYTFTAAVTGKYLVACNLMFKEVFSSGKIIHLTIYQAGNGKLRNQIHIASAAVAGITATGILSLNAGQTIYAQVYHNFTEARQLDNNYCQLSILRVG